MQNFCGPILFFTITIIIMIIIIMIVFNASNLTYIVLSVYTYRTVNPTKALNKVHNTEIDHKTL